MEFNDVLQYIDLGELDVVDSHMDSSFNNFN